MNKKAVYFILSVFCFLHAMRDLLQIMGIVNWFTGFLHIWNKTEWEMYSMVIFLLFGILFLALFLKKQRDEYVIHH